MYNNEIYLNTMRKIEARQEEIRNEEYKIKCLKFFIAGLTASIVLHVIRKARE